MSLFSNFLLNSFSHSLKKILYHGEGCWCPVCEASLKSFLPMGVNPRPNALCPVCRSLERHRMIWLYLKNETDLFSDCRKKMLHIAPEHCFFEKLIKMSHIDYITADLKNRAMVEMDITNIQ